MKKSTMIWVGVGVVLLLAVPVVVMAARRRKTDKPPEKKKSSVFAGSPEVQTQQQFEADRIAAEKKPAPVGPLGGLTQYVESLPTYVVSTKGGDVNIRKEPNTTSEIIGKLKNGTKVKGNPPKDGWVQLARADRAFVSANYLKKVAAGTAAVK